MGLEDLQRNMKFYSGTDSWTEEYEAIQWELEDFLRNLKFYRGKESLTGNMKYYNGIVRCSEAYAV